MRYRQNTGVIDADGVRHKIGPYVSLEPGNLKHIEEAMFLFGAISVGFEFPDYAMDLFNQGKPWSVRPGGTIVGGHDILIVGRYHNHFWCVTWGRLQLLSWSFLQKYMDEGFVTLSPEMLIEGKSVAAIGGFDTQALVHDLSILKNPQS